MPNYNPNFETNSTADLSHRSTISWPKYRSRGPNTVTIQLPIVEAISGSF